MNRHDVLLARGIAAARTGDRRAARLLLTEALRQNSESAAGWLWLSDVLETPQGRSFCLRKVLDLNPGHDAAKKGLAALQMSSPAPAIFLSPDTDTSIEPGKVPLLAPLRSLVDHARFWPVVVACLGAIAITLVGVLAVAAWRGLQPASDAALAVIAPSAASLPVGTLRPTFTPTSAWTPTPLPSDTSTATSTPTATPTPTSTLTSTPVPPPTARPTARRAALAGAPAPTTVPSPTARPIPSLPPRALDPRLPDLGIRIEPAFVAAGQPYWRLVEVHWADEQEAEGKHNIYVNVLNADGHRAVGQPVIVQWASGNAVLSMEGGPPPEWGANFPMYNTLGSYAVSVGGASSDRITGLGLGTAQAPAFTIHTCFFLTFRLTSR